MSWTPIELVSRLGAGGMGEVYLAHDAKLDRPVALKFLSPDLAVDRDRLRRFHQEARAASSLNHPHIVVVHDFGEVDDRPYLVTEFIEGETLRHRLQQGPLAMRDVVDVGVQLASALAAAHARGLVHRDIKPENIMLRPDGYAKVLDFGLAKLAAATGSADPAHRESRTQPGMVVGTPHYMSPEQMRGLDADASQRCLESRRRAVRNGDRSASVCRRWYGRGRSQSSARAVHHHLQSPANGS